MDDDVHEMGCLCPTCLERLGEAYWANRDERELSNDDVQ